MNKKLIEKFRNYGYGLMEIRRAYELREGIEELMSEYLKNKGLAVYIKGTEEYKERCRFPKWYKHKRSK